MASDWASVSEESLTAGSFAQLDVSDKTAARLSDVSSCIPSHPVMVPGIPDADWSKLKYQHGFANQFSTEALPGALPKYQNNPQKCPYHLYAEQLSGTAFTARRVENFRTWMYRILPSVTHEPFQPIDNPKWKVSSDFDAETPTPNQLRWSPLPIPGPEEPVDFVDGLQTICGAGSPAVKDGYGIHMYCANMSMERSCLCNADGNFLIVPQQGRLRVATEMGLLEAPPGYILVVPRGIRFSVALPDGPSRGYVLEVFAGQFVLPELGPIGANGLANPRDFEAPVAAFDDTHRSDFTFNVLHKFGGKLFQAQQNFSPFNVVSWHGNYYPYRYDLAKFCPMNAVSFDHPDPSIFTVLTCLGPVHGLPVADFVIFPPRWTVAENTFRPPYFHRNFMNEFMGLIRGQYEAKEDKFAPGGASLHASMTPHGPDTACYEASIEADTDKPSKIPASALAFMFETYHTPRIRTEMLSHPCLDQNYYQCWIGLKNHFDRNRKAAMESEQRAEEYLSKRKSLDLPKSSDERIEVESYKV